MPRRRATDPEAMKGWKWTNSDARSWYDGKFGPFVPGETLSVEGAEPGDACGRGIHVGKTAANAIAYGKFPGRLFSVRGIGEVLGQDDTKARFASVEVLKELEKPSWVSETEAFIDSIRTVQFFKPRQRPIKKWKHHETWAAAWAAAGAAARDAAWDAARAAARDAAWDAARAAARDAAGAAAWDAAWDAARAAARDAAWDAAGAAAGAAARDAARAASLMALYAISSDLRFKGKAEHTRHVRERWKVWQMGYGLACDVNGVLYTYDKP